MPEGQNLYYAEDSSQAGIDKTVQNNLIIPIHRHKRVCVCACSCVLSVYCVCVCVLYVRVYVRIVGVCTVCVLCVYVRVYVDFLPDVAKEVTGSIISC